MTRQAQVGIRLEAAYLCECGLIVDSSQQCMCGNAAGLLPLAGVLNRTMPESHRARPETGVGARSSTDAFKYDY